MYRFDMIVFIINLLFLSSVTQSEPIGLNPCLNGWTRFESKCYRFHNESSGANFYDALSTCQNVHRSSMLTIHNQQEIEFIVNFTKKAKFSVWLGMMRDLGDVNNTFTWLDRSEMNFTNWAENAPTKSIDKRRFCAVISIKNKTGQWYDVKCQSHYMIVCQMSIQTEETKELDSLEIKIELLELRSQKNRQFITLFFVCFLLFLIIYFVFQFIPFENIRTKIVNHRVFLQNIPNTDTVPFIEKI